MKAEVGIKAASAFLNKKDNSYGINCETDK